MIEFNYNVDLSKLDIVKSESEIKEFFLSGHPPFLIPDFFSGIADIWETFMEFLEKKYDCQIYDQEGGEITSHIIFYNGLVKCSYQAYDICLNEDDDPKNYNVHVEGHIVRGKDYNYFLATKVTIPDLS